MVKKTKSKARLDKFYKIAKEQGYRSRAAFKLIQLNRKYHFLNSANVLVDLCAAPGGWLQVATRYMPMSSIKIGIDLVSIKPVPGCITFQEDITTTKCLNLIKKEIKNNKVDVVLNDGAPNVGSSWSKDAFSQSELVLAALKLACTVLRKGGTFVTKIFRSGDYNSLIWVMNKFFEKVEATKPEASRTQSAEIFVVGLRYIGPDYIDPKLFDSKHIFKDTEADLGHEQEQLDSMKKLFDFQSRRHRGGYDDDMPMTMHRSVSFEDFLFSQNPLNIFAKYNQMKMTEEEKEKYLKIVNPPDDYEELFKDLKVLGKRDLNQLMRWRGKLLHKLKRENKKDQTVTLKDETKEGEDDGIDIEDKKGKSVDERLEDEIIKAQKQELNEIRKERHKKIEALKRRGAVPEDVYNDDGEVDFGFVSKDQDLEELDYVDFDEEEKPQENAEPKKKVNSREDVEANLEHLWEVKKASAKRNEEKRKAKETSKKKGKGEEIDEEKIKLQTFQKPDTFEDVSSDDDDDDVEVNGNYDPSQEEDAFALAKNAIKKSKFFDRKIFKEAFKNENPNDLPTIVNPIKLNKSHKQKNEEEVEETKKPEKEIQSSDDEEVVRDKNLLVKGSNKLKDKRKKKLLEHTKTLAEMEDDWEDIEKHGPRKRDEIEIVPEIRYEDYDLDNLAEMRVLAQKMLRKKDRDQIIDDTYNRYTTPIDEDAPDWFVEDEKRHVYKHLPITKEEYQAEKERLLALQNKPIKKIAEAKIRKHFQVKKKLKKAEEKAKAILDQEGVNEGSKMRQVHSLYKKAMAEAKTEKKYIVGRKFTANKNKGRKVGRNTKLVDSRLKKDKRAAKIHRNSKKIKKSSKSKPKYAKRR